MAILSLCCLTPLFILAAVVLIIGIVFVVFTTKREPDTEEYESEKVYKNPLDGSTNKFPDIKSEASLSLSVIVPAYNEEQRLPPMLDECFEYLESRKKKDANFNYEIILTDDGSSDKTSSVGLEYAKKYSTEKIRVLTLFKNRGKGGAVKMGMMKSRGRLLLFADADGATRFSDLNKLEECLENSIKNKDPEQALGIVVGSRAHLEEEAIATRSFFRTILMKGFHALVWLFCVRSVKDTQCGFKLLTRNAARVCFSNLHITRWAFDVELLYIAEYLKISVKEIAVKWTEIEGSKVVPFWSWLQMGKDLVLLWLRYRIGLWTVKSVRSKND